jgi:adenosylcobyric acid synthase
MVLGCTSGAGKSWLATALCAYYARAGLRVAPFKAQNMSNHARVVGLADGGAGEIGSAQYFQALAAGVVPDVRMNPILLKPEADTRSQVVVLGRVRPELADQPWRERSAQLWELARSALDSLMADYELIVIEGAGSPAEINLADSDYVNTRTALAANAACLLVSDIDRGGSFAHLYGTHALMDAGVRRLLRGFVLNRFRGDSALLAPGPATLEALTGVPTLAVVPMVRDHGLPEEDAVPMDGAVREGPSIVVVAGPHASNLDEFEALRAAGLSLRYSRDAAVVGAADWLILPGSKQTRADLAWLRAAGLDTPIRAHVRAGRPLLAVCGGLQLAGDWLDDPLGLEGRPPGGEAGLGLLPLATRFGATKSLAPTRARLAALAGAWAPLSGLVVDGYEIHLGQTRPTASAAPVVVLVEPASGAALGWQQGPVLGLYLHGLLESPAVVAALFGVAPPPRTATFGRLADVVAASFGAGPLASLAAPVGPDAAGGNLRQP